MAKSGAGKTIRGMKKYMRTSIIVGMLLGGGLRAESSDHSRPNVVYMMLDEIGYFELSSMGHKILKTPNIDRLASEGMRFTQCLSGGPTCALTRSVLLTYREFDEVLGLTTMIDSDICDIRTGKNTQHGSVRDFFLAPC